VIKYCENCLRFDADSKDGIWHKCNRSKKYPKYIMGNMVCRYWKSNKPKSDVPKGNEQTSFLRGDEQQ